MSEEEEKIEPEVNKEEAIESAKPEPKAEKEPKAKASEKKPKKTAPKEKAPLKEKVSEKKPEEADQAGKVSAEEKESEKKEETAADLLGANIEQVKVRKAKGSKNIPTGICFIVATFNNTKVSFADSKGNVISWSSSGKCNFRGSRKSTAYAAQVVTQDAGRVAAGSDAEGNERRHPPPRSRRRSRQDRGGHGRTLRSIHVNVHVRTTKT